jgi:hypothetical protein
MSPSAEFLMSLGMNSITAVLSSLDDSSRHASKTWLYYEDFRNSIQHPWFHPHATPSRPPIQ